MNPNESLKVYEIDKALKSTIIDLVGQATFAKMKDQSVDFRPRNPWKILLKESQEFWRGQRPKSGRSERL